jgi:hypothetical protein
MQEQDTSAAASASQDNADTRLTLFVQLSLLSQPLIRQASTAIFDTHLLITEQHRNYVGVNLHRPSLFLA